MQTMLDPYSDWAKLKKWGWIVPDSWVALDIEEDKILVKEVKEQKGK